MAEFNEYYQYETLQGDTWDSIALDFYNDETYASIIMQANPDHIKTLIFSAGASLVIPIVEDTPAVTLPPWKRG